MHSIVLLFTNYKPFTTVLQRSFQRQQISYSSDMKGVHEIFAYQMYLES